MHMYISPVFLFDEYSMDEKKQIKMKHKHLARFPLK